MFKKMEVSNHHIIISACMVVIFALMLFFESSQTSHAYTVIGNNVSVGGLSTFTNGFISSASSSIGGTLSVSGATTVSSTLTITGKGIFKTGDNSHDPGGSLGPATLIGFRTTGDYGFVNAIDTGVAYKNLSLQASGGNVGIGTTTPVNLLSLEIEDAVTNDVTRMLRLAHNTNGTAANGIGAELFFGAEDAGGTLEGAAAIQGILTQTAAANELGAMLFLTKRDGGTLSEAMRLNYAGNLGIATTSPSSTLSVQGNALISGALIVASTTVTGTLIIGSASGGTAISAHISGVTASINLDSAASSTFKCVSSTVGFTGAAIGDTVVVAPSSADAAWSNGTLSGVIVTANNVDIKYCGGGGLPATDPAAMTYRIDVWKH